MHQATSVWKRGACLVAQWWLLLAVAIASSSAQSTDPSIDAWATATGGALHIQWAISSAWFINNSIVDVEDFRVFVNDQERAIIGLDETGYDLYGLTSETTYTVQVQATLVNGSLAAPLNSNTFPTTTLILAAPDTPDTPELLVVTGGFVQVSVQPPADTGGADLANMTVTVRSADGLTVVQQSQSSNSSALLTYNIYGLDALTAYWVTSVAVNEGGKTSSESNPVVAKTKALQLPDPCPPPRVIRTTGASVVLQLVPPLDDGGGRIQGYNVYMATDDVGGFNEVATTIGTGIFDVVEVFRLSESSDEPLLPETRYIFKAVAVNLVDICVSVVSSLQLANSTDTYTATAAVPGPPPSPYFLQSTGGMITMSLVKTLNMQGATLTGFSIMIKDATGRSITSSITADAAATYNATSLQASSSYDVSAAVVTNLGVSSFSASTSMNTTALSIPTAPRNITIVNITGSTAVAEWSMPLDTGGVDLAGYSIILMSLGSQEERPALASPVLLKDLVANTMHTVKMTVTNAAGMKSLKSESVATSFKTRSPTAPSEPFGISSIFSSGGAIEVSWNPPADRGGERLSTMTYSTSVYALISCFDKQLDASHPCSRCNSVKLLAVQQYQLAAVTTMCEAPTSGVVCPDGTQDCCLTHAGSEYGFGLTCGRMVSVRKPRAVVGTTSAVFSGLNCSSTYYFGVQAINGAGRSATSLLQGLQTTSQTSPTYPVNLRQLTGTGGSIQLVWDAPSDSGGGVIVGYHVYRNYELLTPVYIQPPYTDCGGMVGDTSYVYGVIAVSASLAQGAMATTKLTTESVTPPLSPSLSIAGRSYNRLQLSVVPPCDTGGETALSYEYMVQDKGSTIVSSDFDCCDFTVENLMPKHSYSILVRVINFLSVSEWTKAIYTTTTGIPAVPVATMLQVNTYSAVVALGKPPYDKEISSYDIYLRQDSIEIHQDNVACQEDADLVEYVCPISYQLETLEPDTSYEISVRANGPLGSSVSSSVLFDTSVVSNGTFGMEMTSYTVDKEGVVSTTVLRSDGTSGSVDVGVDVTQTDTVLVRCQSDSGGGCRCTLFLVSSGFPSEPCTLNFADGEEMQSVTFSIWSNESAELLPSPVSVAPFGVALSGQHAALLYIDPRQQPGFVSFSASPTEVVENNSFAVVNVVRLNGSTGELSFDFETFDISAVAGEDYIPSNGTVVFANQESGTQIWIQLIDNHFINDDKMFGLRLTDQTVQDSTSALVTHAVIIHDDESINDAVPRKLDSPTSVYTTGGEFQVEWASSSNDTALVLGYMIRVAVASASVFNLYNTTGSPFTLSGLTARSLYRVEIAAWNSFGLGKYSDSIDVVTQNTTLPSPPRSLEATDVTSTIITLEWVAPRDDGGSAIVGYRVVVEDIDGDLVMSDSVETLNLLFTVDGLNSSSDYVCYVFSATKAFPDNLSATSSAQKSITTSVAEVPGPPPAVTLVGQPRGGTLEIFMNRPRDTGGMSLTYGTLYLRKQTVDGSAAFAVVCELNLPDQTNGSCVVSQLVANTSYELYATFSNEMGESPPGASKFFQTTSAIDLPSPPLNLISPDVTAGNIRLEWDAPADLGGASEVIGYIVYQKYDVLGSTYFTLYDGQDSTERSVTTRGLTRNSSYAFAVVAVNSASFCADPVSYNLSPFREVMTLVSSPLAPPGQPFLVSRTGGRLTVGWVPPDDLAGVALEGYYVELVLSGTNNDFEMLSNSLSNDTTTFTHDGLSESTSYSYVVTAVNQDGPSERSVIFTATTAAVSQPIAVQNFRQLSASGGSITLTWDSPLDTGGREIQYYEIVQDGRSGKFLETSATFEDRSSLNASTDYTYTIAAFNGIYSGYTTSCLGTTGLPSLPDPPLLSSTPFGGRIEVEWRASEYTGGIPISQYAITLYSADGSVVIENVVTTDSGYVFQHLVAQTSYLLSGKTFNDVGESDAVEFGVETGPPDAPGAPPKPIATDTWGGSVGIHVEPADYTGGEANTLTLYMNGDDVHTFFSDERDTIVYGLVAQTQYSFSVSAENTAGETRSAITLVATTAISTPGQVQNLTLVSATYIQMHLTWDAVQDTGGDENLEYDVTYFRCSQDGVQLDTSTQTQSSDTDSIVVGGLQYSSYYSVAVAARTITSLVGVESSSIIVPTQAPLEGVIVAALMEMSVREDTGFVSIPVDRVNGSFGNVSYSFETIDDSALSGFNYDQMADTRTLTPNVQAGVIDIPIVDDTVYNPGISFLVHITDSNTGLLSTTRVILEDDGDAGFISFTQPSISVLENCGIANLDITRTGGSSPTADIQLDVVQNASSMDRFHLLNQTVVFDEGVIQQTALVEVVDNDAFEYVPDSIAIKFSIVDGGALDGAYTTCTLTADDNGDVSLPKQCSNLYKTSVTGGALGLQWTAPVDHGGINEVLNYSVSVKTDTLLLKTQTSLTEATTVYGLTQSTTYQISVQAVNSKGAGLATASLLLTTLAATPPTAPINIHVISASSSTVLLSWDAPLDDGGSLIVAYTIFNAGTSSRSLFPSISCSAPTLCTIKQLLALTSYSIQIQASSAFESQGVFSDVTTFETSSPDYPDPPPPANVTWVSAGAMTIRMFDPVNVGGSYIQEYRLFIQADGDPGFSLVYSGASMDHTVYRLRYETEYYIKYQAVNSVGPSGYSATITNQTLSKTLPSAPTDVVTIDLTGGAITLAWDEPLDIAGRDITGYTIKIVSINGSVANMVGYDGKGNPSRNGTLYDLTASTQYGMQVVAYIDMSNCFDTKLQAWSAVINVTTQSPTLPRTSPELLVGGYTGGIIQLVWVAPKDKGGVPLTGYTLNLLDSAGVSAVLFSTSDTSVLSYTHNDLTANTNFSYTITTSNVAGVSPTSAVLEASTDSITAPSAPLKVRQLTYNTGGAVSIGWDRSFDTGGQAIAGYMVYRFGELVSGVLPSTARTFTNKDQLQASTSYNFTVRSMGLNAMPSMASDQLVATTTAATKPQKALSLSANPGSSYLNLAWIPSGDTGGIPIKAFEVKLLLDSTLVSKTNVTTTNVVLTGLTANTVYIGSVRVYNDVGSSEEISTNMVTTTKGVPDAPKPPSIRGKYGGNFTIQLEPPLFTGGSVITIMKVYEFSLGIVVTLNVVAGVLPTYTYFGVNAESSYTLACSAVNAAGEGPQSARTVIKTLPVNSPGPVLMAPVLVIATGTALTFQWSLPADTGGSLDLTYYVRIEGSGTVGVNPSVGRSYTATQLAYSTVYSISVCAANIAGNGSWSPVLTAMTQPDAAGEFNFAQTSISVFENASQVAIAVQRVSGLSGQVTLTYTVGPIGTSPATVGSDYAVTKGSTTTTGKVVFESLQNQNNIIIFILNDAVYEYPDETFAVTIASVSTMSGGLAKVGSNSMTTVTIMDDGDAGFVSFESPTYLFSEGSPTATVTIIREYGKSSLISLAFDFSGGTATPDVDYRKTTTPVVMDDGVTKATLTFSIINDRVFEFPDEYFLIQMSVARGGAILRQPLTRVTILDDGDVSNPGVCPPLLPLSLTGGSATFIASLPLHNGSAHGMLSNYVVRLSTDTGSVDLKKLVSPTITIGNLNATTNYSVTIAASTSFGNGNFSTATQFSTTSPSLPGAITYMATESRTGGQITFVWSAPDDTGGIPITKYRVYIADSQGTKQIAASNSQPVTRASVYSNLLADTAYDFYLQAGNALIDNDGWGNISASFKFSTGDVTLPGPVILHPGHYEDNTGGKVVLDWDAPLDTGGALISSFTIFASDSSVPWFEAVATYADSGLSAAVTQLSASTAYQFFVLGNNSVLPVKLPGNMSISQGSYVMRTTVDLSSWLSVGSVIKVKGSVFVVGNVSAAATNTISLTSAHLDTTILSQPGELLGQATHVTTQSTTAPTFPDPPPAPILSIATGGMINMTVLSPNDTGGIEILDFSIFLNGKKLSEDSYVEVISKVKSNPFLISSFISVASLEPLTSYNFSALALNSRSLCNFAPIVGPERMFSTTNVSAPGLPRLARYKTTGGGITMTIINPHDTGGKDIQSYRLYYKENVDASPWQLGYNGSKHQATVAHLKPTTNYAFMASVNNGYFDSVNSSIRVVRTTDKSPPGACDPAQSVSATGGMLEVSWDYPPDDGGETVTHYYATIASHLDGSGRMGVNTINKSCVFYRLLALSSYDVTIRAGNSYGYGPESAIATFNTTGVTPPTGEIEVNVELTSGGAASISFDEPIDLGGVEQSQMTYNFYLDRDNIVNISYSTLQEFPVGSIGGSRRLIDVDHRRLQTSAIFSNVLVGGMDPETLYGLQIQPLSSYSSGKISSSFAVATTVPTIPSAPVGLKYDNVTGGSVSLSWGEPADLGGVPLNGYSLYISNVSKSGPFTSKGDDLQTAGITIYGLMPSSKYWAYVNASNDIGTSPSSTVIPFTTRTISAPSSPRNLQITSVGFDSIECAWDSPNDFGGDVINGSIVSARETDSSTSLIEFPVFGSSAVLTGLKSDTAYSIYVVALNTLGDPSPASLTRYAKTSSGPEIVSKPQIGCVSVNSVELFWYPYPAASTYHVFRDGTDIGTTTSSMFADTGVLTSLTSYTIQTASLAGLSEAVVVTTIDPHYTTVDVRCQGKSGHITELSYANNVSKRWRIDPTSRYAYITLKFSSFSLECDHDYVEILDAGSLVSLWKGGCVRTGRFVFQAESSVIVRFHSDDSVTQKGFELTYEIDGDSEGTRIPPPGGALACSGHGRSQSDGTCKCSVGFTGEGCNNRVVCCSDRSRCHHPVCDMDPADVIVVSGEFGDDVEGTGQMMNASEKGTASKAVKTISRAVALSNRGSAILVYPGSYSGLLNRDLKISSSNLTITTLKGPFWTAIDCDQASRFAQSTSSILVVEGLSLQNCIASDGGVFSIADGNFTGGNMLITDSRAVERGGALYTSGSNVTLDHVRIVQISAGADGGALHFVDSNVSMISSNVTQSTALRGGAVALRGISFLSTTDTTFEDNNATGSGGAAYVNGDISLDGVLLLKNKAPNGGGLAMDNGILAMVNCVVENNNAAITGGGLLLSGASTVVATATSIHINDAGTSGGGVYAAGAINVTFDKQIATPSTIMGNTALRGAGMYIFESNATFGGIQVENGSANESAGGIAIVDSDVAWSDVLIQSNEALEGGGLVLNNSRLTCKGPVLLTNNSAEDGGAIWVNSSTMSGVVGTRCFSNNATKSGGSIFVVGNTTVESVEQTLNKAPRGGCMYMENATLSLAESKLTSCVANVSGGGVWVSDSNITVRDVSVQLSTAPEGGGLYTSASSVAGDVTIDSCIGDYYGGGMYLTGATNVSGVYVVNCTAKEGGATYTIDSHLAMEKCRLESSHALEKGGGLYAINASIDLKESKVQDCWCDSLGGGVYLDLSTINHDGATVEYCNATAGGGLFLNESDVLGLTQSSSSQISENQVTSSGGNIFLDALSSVENLVVSFGSAESGGGILLNGTTATIRGCSVVNNSATFGGGLYVQPNSVCMLTDSVISMNLAWESGGGISILDSIIIHDGLSILANTAPSGGGVFVTGTSYIKNQNGTSSQALIQDNTATYSEPATGHGGGLYVAPSSHVDASGLDILDGSASRGSGVFVDGAVLALNDSLIQNGNASYGGGICMVAISSVIVWNCSFMGNYASQSGGAIESSGGEDVSNTLNLNNCSLVANTASISAGGISLTATNLTGSDNVLRENVAVNSSGGGIAFLNQGSATLINWKLVNNTVQNNVTGRGGSIFITSGATVTIADSHVVSNDNATRMLSGGLVYVENAASTLVVANSMLEFGQSYSGGLIYSVDASVYIRNSTLHRGYAFNFGAGIFAVTTMLDISDSIFYDNFAFFGGGGIFIKDGGKLTVRNSFFDSNAVQDSGGAIFLNPGAAMTCVISDSNFTRNRNAGPGSTIFVGRKNYANLTGCFIYDNGGESTDGGSLSVIDANVDINKSVFEANTATKGAAIQISRSANISVRDSTIRSNHATIEGGALHASIRAVATFINCNIERNIALDGGAVYGMGSASITLASTNLTENNARSFGGAISMRGSAVLTVTDNVFEGNGAYTGGAISIQDNASLSVSDSTFQENGAIDFGAGVYINKETETETQTVLCKSSRFGNHTAVAGNDIYWVYYPWFNFDCTACSTLTGGNTLQVSTSAMTVTPGWWPASVTSGVSIGVQISTNSSSGSLTSTTTRRLASGSTADTTESLDSSLIKPGSTVRWPTFVVRDYYGAIASYDNVTRCRAALASDETASFTFNPATWILVDEGYIVFEGAEVLSDFRDTPYQLNVSCTLSPVVQSPLLVGITVDKCNPGYENVRGLCKPCVKGKYSLDGGKCYLCPAGATCEGKDESGTTIGVVFPQRQEGYFMAKTRSTYATSNCASPNSWPSNDPCKAINQTNLADLLLNCSGDAENFDKFWGRNRIFSCLSGHEYYACDTNAACVEAPNVSVSTASVQSTDQCAVGYTGVVCATCADGYYKGSSGTCKLCGDPNDPTVYRTTHLLAMLPLVVAAVAFVFLCYLFTNAAEQRVVSHAQAAKRFQIYRNQSRSRALLLAAKARIERKAYAMMQAIVKRLRSKPPLFHIERRHVHVPWRPEKFKIMLGFFQVMGSFKEVYEIPWPDNMSHLMDICSLADFNFVDTTAAECLFKRDYFANYRLALFALLGMLALVFLVTFWGILKYRVKLSTLPRHCVSCGLPVFALEHGSPNLLARRATLLTKLKMEQKLRSESVEKNESNLLARVKSNFSMSSNQAFERANSLRVVQLVVRTLNWVDRMTQLPASISTHKPRCPTSQRIKNEVRDMVVHSNIRLWRARVWMRLYYKAYQNRCIKLYFWVLLLFYPMLCQRVIGTFYCDEVGDHYYLSLDRSILCYEGTWLYYLPVSITLVVFWVFGVPLLFWVIIAMKRSRGVSDTILLITHSSQDALKQSLLLKMRLDIADHGHVVNEEEIKLFETEMLTHFLRDRNLNEPSTVAQVGFIYHSYDTHFWWFEVWDLGRKLLLNCVISLLAKAGANRIICGLVVMLVYLSVMLFYQPFRDRSDSALAGVTNIQLFITLFCGLILKMGALYLDARVVRLVTSVAIVSNILTLIYAVYSILSTPWKMARRRSREDYRRALAAHVRKLWQSAYGYALTEVYLSNPDHGPMPLLVKNELARREKYQQEMDDLNTKLELTSAMLPPPSPVEHHEEILTASQVDVLEEEDEAPGAASQADALDEDADPDEQTRTGEAVDAAPQAVDS